MAVLSELRYPTTRLAKVFSGLLAVILFAIVSVATISGYLLYQILRPARTPATFDLSVMMGHPTTFSFTLADGTQREGWFFPGLRGAPTVVLVSWVRFSASGCAHPRHRACRSTNSMSFYSITSGTAQVRA